MDACLDGWSEEEVQRWKMFVKIAEKQVDQELSEMDELMKSMLAWLGDPSNFFTHKGMFAKNGFQTNRHLAMMYYGFFRSGGRDHSFLEEHRVLLKFKKF